MEQPRRLEYLLAISNENPFYSHGDGLDFGHFRLFYREVSFRIATDALAKLSKWNGAYYRPGKAAFLGGEKIAYGVLDS